ncbi:hypothetical protein CLV51_10430 [Chitinophaga niastensis]|uniref:Uncharacterized protein n=1 Tax=Chitinophaga niastensis TaxID=536980 RepID=A0A2P8HGJ3_CHINA|nr:hypothetical protein [Chitinophaga niastensis]PSL45328.1 hypothetical protein CLV51_10430 [Chitinophaga niastensis]
MKRINNTICTIVLMMCMSISVAAQHKMAGIYKTMNDYRENHLSYSKDSSQEIPRITLHTLAPRDYVSIQYNGNNIHLNKDQFFAYQLTNGEVYRLAGSNAYQLLNKGPHLLLYKRKIPASPKEFPSGKFKYYFSTDQDNTMKELTAWNIKKAFPDNTTLADQVDALFKRDDELMAYDRFHEMYKLEWLLTEKK